jgi:radical SAM protein with 4Fe4S-binding SPASM domain
MDMEMYKKLIDEIKDTALMIIFWNQGEPFLHQNAIEMIRYNHDNGLFTMTSSNLNHLPDPEGLVRSGLDTLIVSLDGATQETYNKYRINGDFETVIRNTELIIEAKEKLKSSTPVIKWQFIVMKHNEDEISKIKELARKTKVDELIFKSVQIYDKSDIKQFLPNNEKYRRYNVEGDNYTPKGKIANRCRRIFTQPVVNCDGEIAICCFDKDNTYKIGNLKDKSLKELWHSNNFHRWRNIVLKDRSKMDICLNCGEGIDLNLRKI